MIEKILVAVDASARAREVVLAAADVATRFGATLYPLRVVYLPPEIPPAAVTVIDDDSASKIVAFAEKEIAALLEGLSCRVEDAEIGFGRPWKTILEYADQIEADLIVIGSHGYNAVDRVLGTTAGRVVDHSRRSVMVVHPRAT